MPRARKYSSHDAYPPAPFVGPQGKFITGWHASIDWSDAEGGFVWQVLSYIVQEGVAPTVPLAGGMARSFPEAHMALYLAIVELDILKEVGTDDCAA